MDLEQICLFLGLFNWAGDKHVRSWECWNGLGKNVVIPGNVGMDLGQMCSWIGDKRVHCRVYFNGFGINARHCWERLNGLG